MVLIGIENVLTESDWPVRIDMLMNVYLFHCVEAIRKNGDFYARRKLRERVRINMRKRDPNCKSRKSENCICFSEFLVFSFHVFHVQCSHMQFYTLFSLSCSFSLYLNIRTNIRKYTWIHSSKLRPFLLGLALETGFKCTVVHSA